VVELPDGLYELEVHVNLKAVAAEDRMEVARTHCDNLLEMVRMEEEEQQQQQPQDQDLQGSEDGNPVPPQEPPSDWSDSEEERVPNIPDRTWYDWDSEDRPREE
jgi:hypothetical protein